MLSDRRATRWLVVLLVLISCVGCDQWSKRVAQSSLKGAAPRSYLGDTFRLEYTENPGAFLGLGGRMSDEARWAVFVVFNSLLAVGIAAMLVLRWNMSWLQLVACALLLSGAIGNLIDRVMWQGLVIDFLNVGIGPLRTGIFNVADMGISLGAVLLIWESFRTPRPAPAS